MGCSACMKKRTSINTGSSLISCPNKRRKLEDIKKLAIRKIGTSSEENRKQELRKLSEEITELLRNRNFCPPNEFLKTLSDSLNV